MPQQTAPHQHDYTAIGRVPREGVDRYRDIAKLAGISPALIGDPVFCESMVAIDLFSLLDTIQKVPFFYYKSIFKRYLWQLPHPR
jgi:hypothetical protein